MTEQEIAKSREYAQKVAEAAPPLTPDQQLRLAVLLRPDLPVGIKLPTARAEEGGEA